jgi:hypothetical protein
VHPNGISSASYAGVFDPSNPGTRYAADMGFAASTTSQPYSFTVAAGAMWSTVQFALNANTGCSNYALSLRSHGPWATSTTRISGVPGLGTQLTGSDAGWNDAPAVVRRWRRCDSTGASCTDIPGATGSTYTVTDADIGQTLRFRNAATDADATNTVDSAFVEPFIALETRTNQSFGAGDRVQLGQFIRNLVESRCGVPTTSPAILNPTTSYLSDTLPVVTSLVNEPVCLVAHTVPACAGGATPSIYSPSFQPGLSIAVNYGGNAGSPPVAPGAVGWRLPSGASAEVVVSEGFTGPCSDYGVTTGTDAPFARSRPTLSGSATQGSPVAASTGTWTGSPAYGWSWRRCDAAGGACVPIDGANAALYTPTAADVGGRLRVRVSATQGRTVSSDSEPSAVVPAASGTRAAADVTAPTVRLNVARTPLKTVLRRGYVVVGATCSEACAITLRAQVARRLRRSLGTTIASGQASGRAGRRANVRVRLTRKARRALRRRRTVSFTLRATVADAARNRRTISRTVRLARSRRR